MAVLNVRLDDHVRDRLKEMADAEGLTLSEYVRDLVLAAVVPVHEPEAEHGDLLAPETLRPIDRQVLSTLHRILGYVLPEDAEDDLESRLESAKIIEEGFAGDYWAAFGLRTELSKRDCGRVSDILQMFRIITFSVGQLAKADTPVDKDLALRLEFQGFDHNDALELHMAAYVKHQMRDNRWTELRPQVERNDDGNSHSLMLDTYLRMLAEFRRIMDGRKRGFGRFDYLLTLDELQQVAAARVHPSNRP